ncbi:SIR2 family protein [uncultured Imperialibacter sp.]|uniref:SIR2 family protein n=1 Tax=uncultured Imperialibacter sp. TaxID=1672639 RepID=UPI0030DD3EE4|tara:strand:+ start:4746 stop:6038 length:1293 start_codon:yes stop_codon:yes gene_type:complete
MEKSHDPREFIRGIQQILINNTIRIGFLFGAGSSMAAPLTDEDGQHLKDARNKVKPLIPGVRVMTDEILQSIKDTKFKKALESIKAELEENEKDEKKRAFAFMLENIISSIDQKIKVVASDTLCGLDKNGLKELRSLFQQKIKSLVEVHKNPKINIKESARLHSNFARWIKYASRKNAIEVFTTNYDYLFEIGYESQSLPYFDGFVGGYNPFFDPISVENDQMIPKWTRLWKLHGSLGWGYDEDEKRIIRSREISDDRIVIYPSLLKYDDSRKQPYSSYIERLSSFLKKDDGVLFICGYSFGDEHINDTIINALAQSRSTTVIALVFDKELNEDSISVKVGMNSNQFVICGNKSALIGGIFGAWKLKREPAKHDFEFIDQFFDRDGPEPESATGIGDEIELPTGELKLVDFGEFVRFLIELSYPMEVKYE